MKGWRSIAYAFLRASNDINAATKGPKAVERRIKRRLIGKVGGRLMGRVR